MGPYRYDAFHPTGSQRAAKILSCLPPDPEDLAEPMAEREDAQDARDVSFTLRSPVEARVWIDDAAVGTVSSIRQPGSIVVRGLPAGEGLIWRSGEPPSLVRQ